MKTYESIKCRMYVNAICGKSSEKLLNDKREIEIGSVQISKCSNSFDRFYLSNEQREMETLKDRNMYIWIRRFKNLDHKQKLYKDVYESDEWIDNIAPKVEKLIDRNTIVVHNLSPTALSIMK